MTENCSSFDMHSPQPNLQSLAAAHGVTENTEVSKETSSQHLFICEHCQRSFSRKGYLKMHIMVHAGEPFKCPLCDRRFKSYAARKYHMCHQHGIDDANYLDYIKCSSQGFPQGVKESTEDPLQTYAGRQFICEICQRSFLHIQHFWRRMAGHTGDVCISKLGHHLWFVAWSVPRHYLKQYWSIVNWKFNRNPYIFIKENPFDNVCKTAAILSRPQCVNFLSYYNVTFCGRWWLVVGWYMYCQAITTVVILGMGSANETWRYIVTSSFSGWSHTQNDLLTWTKKFYSC